MITHYFSDLMARIGAGWNRFWYTPADPLPLALVRIAAGALATYWLATFTPDLVRFFGPSGLLSVSEVAPLMEDLTTFSYLRWADNAQTLMTLHFVGIAVLVLFTVGAFTRVTSILAPVVVLSYIHRAPMLSANFEAVLSFVLAYLALSPCGQCCSVDAWWRRRRSPAAAVAPSWPANLFLRLLQVHLAIAYFMMAIAKLAGGPLQAWLAGDAMWWLIARPDSRLVDWTVLRDYPLVINAWSHLVPAFELSFALLIWNRSARPLLLAWSVVHWGLLALVSGLVPFCALMCLAGLAFIPGSFWRSLKEQPEGPRRADATASTRKESANRSTANAH